MLRFTTPEMFLFITPLAILAGWLSARTVKFYRELARMQRNYNPRIHRDAYRERQQAVFMQWYTYLGITTFVYCVLLAMTILTYYGHVYGTP